VDQRDEKEAEEVTTKFKVGDRVRSAWAHDDSEGHVGTVVDVEYGTYIVDFTGDDFDATYEHTTDNDVVYENTWCIEGCYLEPVTPPSKGAGAAEAIEAPVNIADPELATMSTVVQALAALEDNDQRKRVLDYAWARFGI